MVELILFILLFFIPGIILLNYLKLEKKEIVVLCFPVSISLIGLIFYFTSFFLPINIFIIYFVSLIFLILFLLNFNNLKHVFSINFRFFLNPFIIFIFILFFLSIFILFFSLDLHFDSLSYHLPLINEFSINGKMPFYQEQLNGFKVIANTYPLLFESITGLTRMFSIFMWKSIPAFIFLFTLFIIYLLTNLEDKKNNWFASIFFGLSSAVFFLSHSFLSDLFLTMNFLISFYFIQLYFRKQQRAFFVLSVFFAVSMILTKFIGLVFLLILLVFVLLKSKKLKEVLMYFSLVVVFSSFFFISKISSLLWLYSKYSSIPSQSAPLINLFFIVLNKLLIAFTSLYFIPVIVFFILAFFSKNLRKNALFLAFFISIFFIILSFGKVNEFVFGSTYRYFLPLYALICVLAGKYFSSIIFEKTVYSNIAKLVFVLGLFYSVIVISPNAIDLLNNSESIYSNSYVKALHEFIPNNFSSKVFFANVYNPILLGLENTFILDFFSFDGFPSGSCEFLYNQKVNRIVFFNSNNILQEFDENNFLTNLNNEIEENKCGKKLFQQGNWIIILELSSST